MSKGAKTDLLIDCHDALVAALMGLGFEKTARPFFLAVLPGEAGRTAKPLAPLEVRALAELVRRTIEETQRREAGDQSMSLAGLRRHIETESRAAFEQWALANEEPS